MRLVRLAEPAVAPAALSGLGAGGPPAGAPEAGDADVGGPLAVLAGSCIDAGSVEEAAAPGALGDSGASASAGAESCKREPSRRSGTCDHRHSPWTQV